MGFVLFLSRLFYMVSISYHNIILYLIGLKVKLLTLLSFLEVVVSGNYLTIIPRTRISAGKTLIMSKRDMVTHTQD